MPDDARNEQIERAINRDVAGALTIRQHGAATFLVAPRSMSEVLEFAKLMSVSGVCIRPIFRGNPGACLAVTLQAMKWGADPFAVANKAFVVNDQISYEAQLIHAIVNSSPVLEERLRADFGGEGSQRRCLVIGMIKGENDTRQYLSPKIGDITPKNSPLWKTDPDQQLFYYSTRAWARRWVPEILLGIYAPDELTIDHEPPPPRPTRAQFAGAEVPAESAEPHEGKEEPHRPEPQTTGDSPQEQERQRRRRRTKAEMEAARAAEAASNEIYPVVEPEGEVHEFASAPEAANYLCRLLAAARSETELDALCEDNEFLRKQLMFNDPISQSVDDTIEHYRSLLAAAAPATTESPKGTDDAPEPDRQAPPEPTIAPPAEAPAGQRPDYRIPEVYTKTGEIDRAWFVALFKPKLLQSKSRQEFEDRIADNADITAGYMKTLQPPSRIAAMKELDDIHREIPA